jgi:hypothetical protein
MKKTSMIIAAFACVSSLLLMQCANPNAGNGSDTGNAMIASMLYNPDGTPANHAVVRFFRFGTDPRTGVTAIDSTTTDAKGNYTAKLDTGTYNILANGGGNATFQDSIKAIKDSTVHPPADTLKATGSLKGIVRLEEGGDPTTVFVLFMGANVFTTVQDSAGNFATTDMAKGRYQVKLLSTLDNYKPKDTVLTVTAGSVDSLPGPIVLQYTGIPVPRGLTINYDTLKQIVNLSWNKPAIGRMVAGYDIYRQRSDSTSFANIKSGVKDTVFQDSTGVQDQTYEYRVAVVDSNNTIGVMSAGVSAKVTSVFILTDSIVSPMINSSQANGFAIGKDTTIYVAAAGFNNFIRVLSKTGDSINAIGKGNFKQVYDIAIDSKENIFAVDPDNNAIFKFLKNGTFVSSWPINIPTRIAIDTQDNIYVVFSDGRGIMKLDTLGNKMDSTFFSSTTKAMEGNLIIGSNGNLFVGSLTAKKIFMFSSNLAIANSFTLAMDNHALTELHAIDNKGNLYLRNVRSTQPDLEYDVFTSAGGFVAKLQPGVGDYLRILGGRLYLMSQTGLLIYGIPF